MAREPFLINPAGLGESLVVLGVGNPRRRSRRQKRRNRAMARRRRVRSNEPGRRRRRHRMPAGLARYWASRRRPRRNPRRRSRRMHSNVRHVTRYRYRTRGYHRNLRRRSRALGAGFAITRPATWVPGVLSAGAGAVTATVLPRMVVGAGATTPVVYAIQAGVGVAGATVLGMTGLVRTSTAFFFFVGATVPIVSDLFARFVLPWLGMAAYSYETAAELAELGQEPHYPPTLSAYSYEAVGAEEEEALGDSPQYNVDTIGAGGYGSAAPEGPWARSAMVG